MSKTGAAFSVRFLKNGDQITIVRDVIDKDGNGAGLYQVVEPTSGAVAPDWTKEENQPIIQLSARSAAGYPVEVTGVLFAYDGETLNFTYNGTTWVTASNNEKFQSRITSDGKYQLKIVGNIASSEVISNKQITYSVSYVCNAMTDTVQGSVDILIQQAGSDSHTFQIITDHSVLDTENPTATLTAEAMYGTSEVTIGQGGYTIEWYKDGELLSGQTSATLKVTREDVTGGSLYIAKLLKDGSVVAQDSQRISDISDEYQISYEPTDAGSNYVSPSHNATYTLSITENGAAYSGDVSYAWQVYNSLGEAKTSGTGSTVTVTPTDCMVGSGTGAYYADADVQVTAEF